ncbi:MAG: prenyltransferase [Theionarchaea archaeon]|nr:prenyltransferase [Theionarchaea archaeon]
MRLSGRVYLAWIKALRLVYYPTTGLVLLVGISVSFWYSALDTNVIVWMIVGNVLLHCACSLINEYADYVSGADLVEYPELKWTATGGSRVLVNQLIDPGHVLVVSFVFLGGSYVIWLGLAITSGYALIFLLTISLGITFMYSAAVTKGGFYYIRELLLALVSVPTLVVAVVRILSGVYSFTALAAGIVVGMQMLNYLLYHGLIDLEADLRSGKKRLTRVLGAKRTRYISELLIVGTFVILGILVYDGVFPAGCILPFVLVPLAGKILYAEMRKVILENYTPVVLLFVISSLLLSVGFWF